MIRNVDDCNAPRRGTRGEKKLCAVTTKRVLSLNLRIPLMKRLQFLSGTAAGVVAGTVNTVDLSQGQPQPRQAGVPTATARAVGEHDHSIEGGSGSYSLLPSDPGLRVKA